MTEGTGARSGAPARAEQTGRSQMHIHIRLGGLAVLGIALAAAGVIAAGWIGYEALLAKFRDWLPTTSGTPVTTVVTRQIVVMPTTGGQLEIATAVVDEVFTRADPKVFDPKIFSEIDLGTTISEIRTRATYRYHIKMDKEWRLTLDGETCLVRAGQVEPTLPASFDTATLQKRTESGWARFNKNENLRALELSLTEQLANRAPRYQPSAADAGRSVVAAFVATWLLREGHWTRDPQRQVIVLFPGEPEPTAAQAPH